MASIVMTRNTDSCACVVVTQKRYIFMRDPAPCNNSRITRAFLDYKGIPVLEWPGYSTDINPKDDVWNIV